MFGYCQVLLWRFLRLLDNGMKQNHIRAVYGKENTGNAIGNMRPDFPEVSIHLANLRITDRPEKLNSLDIAADGFSVIYGEGFEPITDRLIPI